MTPTRELLLYSLPRTILSGYYIDSEDGQPNPLHVYCRDHAYEVARRWGLVRKTETYVCGAWAGSDSPERCAITTCGVSLNCGGLTSYGVDCALGLTEEDPHQTPVCPEELELAADSMLRDDPRWALWDYHVLALVDIERKKQEARL